MHSEGCFMSLTANINGQNLIMRLQGRLDLLSLALIAMATLTTRNQFLAPFYTQAYLYLNDKEKKMILHGPTPKFIFIIELILNKKKV